MLLNIHKHIQITPEEIIETLAKINSRKQVSFYVKNNNNNCMFNLQ